MTISDSSFLVSRSYLSALWPLALTSNALEIETTQNKQTIESPTAQFWFPGKNSVSYILKKKSLKNGRGSKEGAILKPTLMQTNYTILFLMKL